MTIVKEKQLNQKQEMFCQLVASGETELDAYRKAYGHEGKESTVRSSIHRLKHSPHVRERIRELKVLALEKLQFGIPDLLKQWVLMATTSVTELIEHRRNCCRFCYGIDGNYQWIDEKEFAIELARALDDNLKPPTNDGGFGFNPTLPLNEGCKRCFGEGIGSIFITDTRNFSPGAKLLYRGIRKAKNSIEVLVADQQNAREMIAKYLGMFDNDKKGTGPGAQKELPFIKQETVDPIEASKIYQQIIVGDR